MCMPDQHNIIRGHCCIFCPLRAHQEVKKADVVSKFNIARTFEESVFNEIHIIMHSSKMP